MKKIYLLILVVITMIGLVGCKSNESKEVKTTSDFQNVASNKGFTMVDNNEEYVDVDYITESYKATINDMEIEMIVYKTSETANKVQDGQEKNFKNLRGTGTELHNDEGKNYRKFWMISNGYYMVSSRIDNTLIFAKVLLENREKVDSVLEDMGY